MSIAIKDNTGIDSVSYNGFEFGPADENANVLPPRVRLRGSFQYDDAGRRITHTRYRLSVMTYVFASTMAAMGESLDSIRAKLSKPGKELVLDGMGFSAKTTIAHQANDTNWIDLAWGPKPVAIDFVPMGGGQCWEVHWECEFNISDCANAQSITNNWMALNYETTYSYDDEGFATRVISGYVEVAQFDVSGRKTADFVKDHLYFRHPASMHRVREEFFERADKKRIEFVIADEEWKHDANPPGTTQWDVHESYQNAAMGFNKWNITFSGTVKASPDVHKAFAAYRFFTYVLTRLQELRNARMGSKIKEKLLIPQTIKIDHGNRTRSSSFSVSFLMVHCLTDLLSDAGIWQHYNEFQANADANDALWGTRGYLRQTPYAGDDILVDLCERKTNAAVLGNIQAGGVLYNEKFKLPFKCEVTKEKSYVAYEMEVKVIRQESQSIHRTSTYFPGGQQQYKDPTGLASGQGVGTPFEVSPGETENELEIIETEGGPKQFVILRGKGNRLGFEPVYPELIKIGGKKLKPYDSGQDKKIIGDFFGCPMYLFRYYRVYTVDGYIPSYKTKSTPEFPCAITDDKGNLGAVEK